MVGFIATIESAELGLDGLKPSELKEIEKEIAAGNVPPNYTAEKPKRGVAKLTNADSPQFNHLGSQKPYSQEAAYQPQSTYSVQPQATYSQAPAYQQQQYRLVYPNQYYPANQYLSYLQNPQIASQLAQYSYQPSGVPHYVQTPTQIQYVSPPSYQSVPSAQFKALTSKTPAVSAAAPAQNQATSQVLLPSNMAYHQPQVVMYLVPQQLAQQQQQLVYPGQQMYLVGAQNPLLGFYNQHRFGVPGYSSPAVSQVSFL